MKALAGMDLYKGIILASLLLLPAAGGWGWWLQGRIDEAKKALGEAPRLIEEIGSLQKQMETVVTNDTRAQQAQNASEYFERQLMASARGGGISRDDFSFSPPTEQPSTIGRGQRVNDIEVDILFGKPGSGRTDFKLTRDYLFAVLFNSEQQIWKLRSLEIVNATEERRLSTFQTPPLELADEWIVKKMKFARRTPGKDR